MLCTPAEKSVKERRMRIDWQRASIYSFSLLMLRECRKGVNRRFGSAFYKVDNYIICGEEEKRGSSANLNV
jgi:hypothetical protein